jgi:hypothetical protein
MADLLNDEQIAEFKDVFVIFDQGKIYLILYLKINIFQMMKNFNCTLKIKLKRS